MCIPSIDGRNIFLYWNGPDKFPVIRRLRDLIKKLENSSDVEVFLVTRENVAEFVDFRGIVDHESICYDEENEVPKWFDALWYPLQADIVRVFGI